MKQIGLDMKLKLVQLYALFMRFLHKLLYQLNFYRTTSNALLYGEKTNSNAIGDISHKIRNNSNALIYLNKTRSNEITYNGCLYINTAH